MMIMMTIMIAAITPVLIPLSFSDFFGGFGVTNTNKKNGIENDDDGKLRILTNLISRLHIFFIQSVFFCGAI